jgi:hypothetical protein
VDLEISVVLAIKTLGTLGGGHESLGVRGRMLWFGAQMSPKSMCIEGFVPRLVLVGGGGTFRM